MGFVNIMDQNMAKYRIGVQIKKMVVVPVCLNGRCCSSGCVGINQDKAMSLSLLWLFEEMLSKQFFLEFSKEGKLPSSDVRIRNIPSDVCYDKYR